MTGFCSETTKISAADPLASVSAKKVTYTDRVGRKVKLTANIKKIVLIRTSDIYMLSAILGKELDQKLIAVGESFKTSDIDGYNQFKKVYKNLDKMKTMGSVYDNAISVEKMVSLKPDLIIVDKQFFTTACIQKMISVGLPVAFTDDNSNPFYGNQNSMKMLGNMLGKTAWVNQMVNDDNTKTAAVLSRIQKVIKSGVKKPVLYWECGNVTPDQVGQTDGDVTVSWGYIWNKLGVKNISLGTTGQPLNAEKVLAANPDIIIIGGKNWDPTSNIMRLGFFATKKSASNHLGLYTKRAGWSGLKAIKNKRLYALYYGFDTCPYTFAGVEAMAKMLYPSKFTDLNPDKDLKNFFRKYMKMNFSGALWAQWGDK
jgi:iron complex transport system substrate-binding protein